MLFLKLKKEKEVNVQQKEMGRETTAYQNKRTPYNVKCCCRREGKARCQGKKQVKKPAGRALASDWFKL